jgi:hypothetical protein
MDWLKQTIVLQVSYRRPCEETDECIANLRKAGALLHQEKGYSAPGFGRSQSLTTVLDGAIKEWGVEALAKRVVLLVDDDATFRVSDALELVTHTGETGRCASGVAANANGFIAAFRSDGMEWEVGMHFAAVRLDKVHELSKRLPRLRGSRAGGLFPFFCEGVHPSVPDRWTPEDFWFCREMGGFDLLPIGVGHIKQWPLYPDQKTLDAIRNGTPLEDMPPAVQHQGKFSELGAPVSLGRD